MSATALHERDDERERLRIERDGHWWRVVEIAA
jgi:hypothetical protein